MKAMNTSNSVKRLIHRLAVLFAFAGAMIIASSAGKAYASATVSSIDYDRSEMTVALGATDTVLYISDSKAKSWELMAEKPAGATSVTIDISWISPTKDYVMTLKTDASDDVEKVKIPKQSSTFKATFNLLLTKVNFTNATGGIQWRKKESLGWNNYDDQNFPSELESFCANGAALYFRLAQVKGTSADDPGSRPSKEVALTVPKKTAAPAVKINDNTMSISLDKGTQYRYLVSETGNPLTDAQGNYVEWTEVTSTKSYKLSDLAPQSLYSAANTAPTKTYIQFRTKQTSSKQMSMNSTITVPEQQAPLVNDDDQLVLKYTSSTTFQIIVKNASTTTPYQYCLLDPGTWNGAASIDDIAPEEITWVDITASTGKSFSKTTDKIEEGTQIYVRKKAVKAQGDEDYKLASPAYKLTPAGGVQYPGDAYVVSPTGDNFIWLQTVAGVCNSSNSDGNITFTMYSPSETTIKSIKFVDYNNGSELGSCSITSSVAKNAAPSSDDDKYIITTTIKSTEGVDSHTRTRMLAHITYDSGSTFESTVKSGIGLYIYPATKVDNPSDTTEKVKIGKLFYGAGYDKDTDFVDYSTAFKRVYLSNKVYGVNGYTHENEDRRDFKFVLKLGTVYTKSSGILSGTPDLTYDVAGGAATALSVSKIKYDSVELTASCYDVQYKVDKDEKNNDVRLALVTVHCDEVEKIQTIDDRNKDTAVVIYLNNGEIIDSAVTLNLVKTATIDASPKSWSVTPASLEVIKTVTTTPSGGGSPVTTTEKVYDFIIDMTLFDSNYSVAVSDVTWNGTSVYDKAEVGSGKIKLYLSNEKLKKLGESLGSSGTYNLCITFSNGFRITDDCQMTLLK